jgi:predicted nucleotidyltransferase
LIYTRTEVKAKIAEFLKLSEAVIAVWEGGSAATGFLDEYSDLDLSIVIRDGATESVIEAFENFIAAEFKIVRKHRLAEPTWHGFSQCFYKIDKVSEWLYLDVCFIQKSIKDKFTEPNRHGHAVVWFQKESILDETETPLETIVKKGKRLYQAAVQMDFIMELEIKKAIRRGLFSEAFSFYYGFINRSLGILLNLKYRPEKADFGLRYAYRDFGIDDYALIDAALKVASIQELETMSNRIIHRYLTLKQELALEWGSD